MTTKPLFPWWIVGGLAVAIACGSDGKKSPDDDSDGGDDEAATDGEIPVVSDCQGLTYRNAIAGILEVHCVSCHNPAFPPNTVQGQHLFTTFADAKEHAAHGYEQVAAGSMPMGDVLAPDTKQKLLTWFACGTPE